VYLSVCQFYYMDAKVRHDIVTVVKTQMFADVVPLNNISHWPLVCTTVDFAEITAFLISLEL